jgi:hypothetical protein
MRNSILLAFATLSLLPVASRADVTDECKSVLKQMSDTLTAAKSLKATGTRSIDPKLIGEGAAKEQAQIEIIVQRPANILATSRDKDSTRQLYYDGKRLTITDKTEVGLFHAGADFAADSIDAFSAELLKRHGYQPPMTEFFTADPYKLLLEDVESGNIAGEESIAGVDCQHLSFSQEGFTWDLWVAKSDHLPRKFVIKFLEIDGSPKIEANITAWDLKIDTSKTKFSWEAPKSAVEIGIIPAEPTEEATEK